MGGGIGIRVASSFSPGTSYEIKVTARLLADRDDDRRLHRTDPRGDHEYIVTFNPGGFAAGTILVQYQPPAIGAGALPPLQEVNAITIPPDITFAVRAGFPASAPDGFGSGIAPIDFGQTLGAGSLNYVAFMPDGSSRDTLGNYNSGVIYLTRAADTVYASRAITVWGATGRVRGWRLYNPANVNTWVQQ
jgi:hypothetical protein